MPLRSTNTKATFPKWAVKNTHGWDYQVICGVVTVRELP